MAISGHWTAPDGTVAKIDPGSLVPGVEERDNPPVDGKRSYATQLMNIALINDINQKKIPPMFYSQERPNGQGDNGERLKYANGSSVLTDDVFHNGDKSAYNSPDVLCKDISNEGQLINGEGKFVIANASVDNADELVHVSSKEDLGKALTEMKKGGKLPAIIMVDANNKFFEGANAADKPGWHVISITGYDESTGTVNTSNEWGKRNDKDMSLDDLYRSTMPH
jgi:hypothetical protein